MTKRFLHSEYLPLILLIAASLIIAAFTLTRYGETWDEDNFYNYARESLNAYVGIAHPGYIQQYSDPTLRYYGAWTSMVIVLVARLFPHAYISDVAHALTFNVFQLGVVIFYLLARRWLSAWPAFGATALFATQPLFLGHAFINPRDIPFMVAFMASVYFGLRMVDSFTADDLLALNRKSADITPFIKEDWNGLAPRPRSVLLMVAIAGSILLTVLSTRLLAAWQTRWLIFADTTSARDLDLYLRPILGQVWNIALPLTLCLLLSSFLFLPRLPRTRTQLQQEFSPYVSCFTRAFKNPILIAASLVLGLTISIRILGFAAAVLVLLYALYKHRLNSVVMLIYYGLFSLPIIYATWPYLWPEPILRTLLTLKVMLHFPWPGKVLFEGALYAGNELPWYYLPKLMTYQLTESLWVLVAVGLAVVGWKVVRSRAAVDWVVVAAPWFILPLGLAVVSHPYLYDNFRQWLFILPPLFLLAGFALDALFARLRLAALRFALLIILLAPGLYATAKLFPYQYIYYNAFAGGTAGAFRQYEFDYWGTSFRELAPHLSDLAPAQADVVVWGPSTVVYRYSRPGFTFYDSRQPDLKLTSSYYAVILARNNDDINIHPEAPVLYSVEKDGAILAVIKLVKQP